MSAGASQKDSQPRAVTIAEVEEIESHVDGSNFFNKQRKRFSEQAVIVKLNDAKRSSDTHLNYFQRICIILVTSTCFTIILCLFMCVPISKIIMGIIFFHECPVEPFIPLYLIVGGVVACIRDLVSVFLKMILTDAKYTDNELLISVIAIPYILAEFAWFIYGSIFVFKTLTSYQWIHKHEDTYCSIILYMYAFVITAVSYFLLVMFFLVTCITLCLARFMDNNDPDENQKCTMIVINNI